MIVENFYLNTAVIVLTAYLIGSFSSTFIAGKIRSVNILKIRACNVGGMEGTTV